MTERLFSSSFTLGILGGGQLGKMLLAETRRYDIRTAVLDPAADAPARLACNHFTQGSLTDASTVVAFGQQADVITIEIENVSLDGLETLEQQGKRVFPQPRVLRILQNKAVQKTFYAEHNIPTAPFGVCADLAQLNADIAAGRCPLPFVWKAATGGYDGKGVSIVKTKEDLAPLPEGPCLWETLVDFEKEIAVVVARSSTGEIKSYPAVDMDFHPTANLVEFVVAPSRYPEAVQQRARQLAENLAQQLNLTGILAVEMFLTRNGDIWVNECAPRVHNSGHLTIEAALTSQFEQHLRAILGLPLGATEWRSAAAMANVVGAEGFTGPVVYEGMDDVLKLPGVYVHLYGKSETRPFRKMGHLTAVHATAEGAIDLARRAGKALTVKSTQP
jgi:5-(carboxyamino)imidazole ribonucleotide synthase